jgi:flagellin
MTVSLRTNLAALGAQTQMNATTRELHQSMANLASGLRINVASDDAAGLAISEKLKASISSLEVASRNANDGISLLQTAEGALSSIGDALVRMRELAMQAATDTLTDADRAYVQDELAALRTEVDRIAATTHFNGRTLLDGTFAATALDFQVGVEDGANHRISINLPSAASVDLGDGVTAVSVVSVATKAGARAALAAIDGAIGDVTAMRSRIGASQHALNVARDNATVANVNHTAANSRIRDVDVAAETARFVRTQILQQAGAAVLAQANSQPQIALALLK